MNTEKQKIEKFLAEAEKLLPTNPDLVAGFRFFELWEHAENPWPFSISAPDVFLGPHQIVLPVDGDYIARLAWDGKANRPVFYAENPKTVYLYPLHIASGKIRFKGPEKISLDEKKTNEGEEIEVIYDVIDHVMTQKKGADIFSLSKKEFTKALEDLAGRYDRKLLNRMARLNLGRIKEMIQTAASDMAVDELSPQMGLPLGDSYAYNAADATETILKSGSTRKEEWKGIRTSTRWEAAQEISLLAAVSQYHYEMEKDFALSLEDCELISTEKTGRGIIRLPGVTNMPLFEGAQLAVRLKGPTKNLGTFLVSIADDDTVYGEISWDYPEYADKIHALFLHPLKHPLKIVMEKTHALYHLLKNQDQRIKGALGHILGCAPLDGAAESPAQDSVSESMQKMRSESGSESGSELDPKLNPKDTGDMDFSQKSAFTAAIHPKNRVTAIQGPPGTGKTWVLAQVIQYLCRQGKRILATAPSNTAVDNILKRIPDLPILRLGKSEKIDITIRNTCWFGDEDNVASFIKKRKIPGMGAVYGATHVRSLFDMVIARELEQNGLFDYVVYDEAGMSRMDEFLLCAQMGHRVVIFGDQQQLPPFPLSAHVIKRLNREHPDIPAKTREIITSSALEWLACNRRIPLWMLQRSYRCQNPRLLRFSSTLFYNARVKASEKAEYLRLPYHERKEKYPPATLRFYSTSTLPEDARFEKLILTASGPGLENSCEAGICREALIASLVVYDLSRIMIITPYNAQVRLIKKMLRYETVKDQLPETVSHAAWKFFLNSKIATVDSFQGGEDDLVIISYVRSNKGRGIGFVDNPNRINVAHTRCRRGIIIIGDLECLKTQAKTDIFIKMERAFNRDGEIIAVSESSFTFV